MKNQHYSDEFRAQALAKVFFRSGQQTIDRWLRIEHVPWNVEELMKRAVDEKTVPTLKAKRAIDLTRAERRALRTLQRPHRETRRHAGYRLCCPSGSLQRNRAATPSVPLAVWDQFTDHAHHHTRLLTKLVNKCVSPSLTRSAAIEHSSQRIDLGLALLAEIASFLPTAARPSSRIPRKSRSEAGTSLPSDR